MEVLYATTSAIMVRKELAGDSFRFDEDLPLMEVWERSSRLSRLGPAAYLDCELAIQGVHTGPRGTDASEIAQASVRIRLLQRIWGVDERFLEAHAARYRNVLKAQYVRRAELRISAVELTGARKDLSVLGGPLAYRMIASLPPVVVRSMLGVKRRVLGRSKQPYRFGVACPREQRIVFPLMRTNVTGRLAATS